MVTPGAGEANGPHTIKRDMKILAEQVNDLQTGFAMLAKKLQQVLALDERDLRVIHDLSRKLIGLAGHGGAQAQDFSGRGDTQHEPLARLRADGKLGAALAKDKDAARGAAFVEQGLASRHLANRLDAVESEEGIGRKVAKNTVRTQFAVKTATLMRCALHMRSYRSPLSKETVTVVTNYRDGLFDVEVITHHREPTRTIFQSLTSAAYSIYDVLAIDFSAALLRISSVEPFAMTIWRFFKSANRRVTVSREVPIICAISS
jgi:hypothetical protein